VLFQLVRETILVDEAGARADIRRVLETLREFFTAGSARITRRPAKPIRALRFGQDQVAEHGPKLGGYAAGGGVVSRAACRAVRPGRLPLQRTRKSSPFASAQHSLLHAGNRREAQTITPGRPRSVAGLNQPGQASRPPPIPSKPAHEAENPHPQCHGPVIQPQNPQTNRISQAGAALAVRDPTRIAASVFVRPAGPSVPDHASTAF